MPSPPKDPPDGDQGTQKPTHQKSAESEPKPSALSKAGGQQIAGRRDGPDSEDKDWEQRHSWWGNVINGAIGVFTFCGFLLLLYQVWDGKRNAEESERNTRSALANSERSAKAAEDLAQTALLQARLGQRPWVGVNEFPVPNPAIGSALPTNLSVVVKNTGNSPAIDMRTRVCGRAFKVAEAFSPACNPRPGTASSTVLWPGMTATLVPGLLTFDGATVADLRSGKRPMYVWGEIRYRDTFTEEHVTTFCLRILPDLQSAEVCGTYNSAT